MSNIKAAVPEVEHTGRAFQVLRGRELVAVLVPPEWFAAAVKAIGEPGFGSPPGRPAPAERGAGTAATPATKPSGRVPVQKAAPGPPPTR